MSMPKPNEFRQLNKNKLYLFFPYALTEYAKIMFRNVNLSKITEYA